MMLGKGVKMLTDLELNSTIKSLAAEERKLTKEILLHIAEVDKRRLYLKMAYPSLYEYLTKEIGYSEGSAQRRIDAARLINKLPEVSNKIESGDLNLSQISKVQRICRQLKKETGKVVETAVQKQIFEKLENQTSQQTDFILANEFQMEIKAFDKVLLQKDESQRVELTFSKKEMAILKQAQSLVSNKAGGGLKDTILEMAKKVVSQSELKQSELKQNEPRKERNTVPATVAVKKLSNTTKPISKAVPLKMKKEIKQRDQRCQFTDVKTGRKCESKHFLEIDHIQPKYQGGQNEKENLRVLCRNHNQYRYSKLMQN